MAKKKQGNIKIGKVLSYAVIILILAAACGALAFFTNGFTTDFTSFYVVCNEKEIMSSAGGYYVSAANPLTVDVKYTFDFVNDTISGYTVKVVPNTASNADFDFTIDGDVYSFYAETDLTDGFDIEYGESSFTIAPKGNMQQVLSAVYPASTVTVERDGKDYSAEIFTLAVTSYNGEKSVYLNFAIADETIPAGIALDKEVIVL